MNSRPALGRPRLAEYADDDASLDQLRGGKALWIPHGVAESFGVEPSMDIRAAVQRLLPWWRFWGGKKKSFDHGVWICRVAEDEGWDYAGTRPRHLPFHNDMTRYLRPPEFTLIRCVEADPKPGAGANRLLHVDDLIQRLRTDGHEAWLRLLTVDRPLNLREGARIGPLVTEDDPTAPSRVFDPTSSDKVPHAELSPADIEELDRLQQWCDGQSGLWESIKLAAGDLVVFSNHRFLHARSRCSGPGRTTEVCLGDAKVR